MSSWYRVVSATVDVLAVVEGLPGSEPGLAFSGAVKYVCVADSAVSGDRENDDARRIVAAADVCKEGFGPKPTAARTSVSIVRIASK